MRSPGARNREGADQTVKRGLLVLVCALFIVEAGLYSSITPLLPHYVRALRLSDRAVGPLCGAYALGLILGTVFTALLSGRVSVRLSAGLGLQILAGSSVVFGFASAILLLDLMRFTSGVGAGFIWCAGITWIVGAEAPERRGAMLGTALGAGVLGTLLGPAIGTLAIAIGIPEAFGCVAGVALLFSVAVSRQPSPPCPATSSGPAVLRVLFRPRVRSAAWLMCLLGLICGAVNVIIPLRLAHLGAGSVTIGVVFLLSAALGGVVTPIVGRVADRRGTHEPIRIGLIVAVGLLGAIPASESVAELATLTVLALGMMISTILAPAGTLLSRSVERLGVSLVAASATVLLCFSVGEAIGPPLAAGLAQASSDATPMLALATLSLLALGLFVPRRGGTSAGADR